MHTHKALQVDVLALQHCNSLATQNTLDTETGKQNPNSAQCYIQTTKESYLLHCECVCVCPSVCLHVCVFKQDTNIDCSLIILPSALFKASINSLMLWRHSVDTERRDKVVGFEMRHVLLIETVTLTNEQVEYELNTVKPLALDQRLRGNWDARWVYGTGLCIFVAPVMAHSSLQFVY